MNVDRSLFFFVAAMDKFPFFRPDVAVLFGKEMCRRGHSMQWLAQSEATSYKSYNTKWECCRVRVIGIDAGNGLMAKLRKQWFAMRMEMELIRILLTPRRFDFVQVKDKFVGGFIALLICRLRGMKMTFWLSYPFPESYLNDAKHASLLNSAFYYLKGKLFWFLLYHIIMPFSDHNFVQSEQMKRDVVSNGVDGKAMTVVPMGIDRDKIEMVGIEPAPSDEPPTVIFTAVFFKVRRLDFVIRVFDLVRQEIPVARFFMIGAGKDDQDDRLINDEIVRLGLEDAVELPGFVPFDVMLDYVRRADLCLSPYYPSFLLNSTSPTKLIEYMAMGKAVVANDHPEQRLILEESGGGLCVPYDERAFADAIVELLRDPQRCVEMGRKGQAYVLAHRTYDVIADKVEQIYYNVLDR